MKLFDKLNTPMVLVLVLGFVVAANGLLLLYRYTGAPETSDPVPLAVQEEETPTNPSTTEETTAGAAPGRPEAPEPRNEPESERPEREPEASEREPREPQRDTAPPAETPPTLVDALAGCETADEECVAAYIAGIAPEAEYVEEVPDANSAPSQENRLFYFRDPTLAPCQYSWENYTFGDGITYTAIIYGEGSFDEDDQECIPAF